MNFVQTRKNYELLSKALENLKKTVWFIKFHKLCDRLTGKCDAEFSWFLSFDDIFLLLEVYYLFLFIKYHIYVEKY